MDRELAKRRDTRPVPSLPTDLVRRVTGRSVSVERSGSTAFYPW
jgi:hypothetical protein